MYVDSKKHQLDQSHIVMVFLKNNPQNYPDQVVIPAILTELSDPKVKTKQFGNTLFEVIPGQNNAAFFKAFNADTGQNFVNNSKIFCVWARRVLGLTHLVTQFTDPAIEKLFEVIKMNPPMPGMGYEVHHLDGGVTQIDLTLGE